LHSSGEAALEDLSSLLWLMAVLTAAQAAPSGISKAGVDLYFRSHCLWTRAHAETASPGNSKFSEQKKSGPSNITLPLPYPSVAISRIG
jgi:hypothetical protein